MTATLASITFVRALTSVVLWRLEGFPTYSLELALLTGAAVALLLAGAAGRLGDLAVGGGLVALLVAFTARRYRQWASQLGHLLQEIRRTSEAG